MQSVPITTKIVSLLLPVRRGLLNYDTTLCDKVCPLLAVDLWFSLCNFVAFTQYHDINDTLLKVIFIFTITKGFIQSLGILHLLRRWLN